MRCWISEEEVVLEGKSSQEKERTNESTISAQTPKSEPQNINRQGTRTAIDQEQERA